MGHVKYMTILITNIFCSLDVQENGKNICSLLCEWKYENQNYIDKQMKYYISHLI